MAEGQAETQPVPEVMNPFEAVGHMAAFLEREEAEARPKEESKETPRNEKGQFAKEEPKADKAEAPAEETPEAPAPEEPTQEAQPETRRFKLKYKGEELEKEEPEVIELAQKGFDYTQKSQALAKEREEAQAKIKAEQEAARKAYEQQLEVYRQSVLRVVDPEVLNADLGKIAAEDPARAQQLFFKRQQIAETLQAVQVEQQRLANERSAKAQEELQKQVKESWEALETDIPGWNRDRYSKVLEFSAKTYGFKQEEVNAITDHRAIKVLDDARQWREYLAAKPKTVDKKVASVPKVQKPGSGEAPPKPDKYKEGMARLEKTGSRGDAQSLVEQMLADGRI